MCVYIYVYMYMYNMYACNRLPRACGIDSRQHPQVFELFVASSRFDACMKDTSSELPCGRLLLIGGSFERETIRILSRGLGLV